MNSYKARSASTVNTPSLFHAEFLALATFLCGVEDKTGGCTNPSLLKRLEFETPFHALPALGQYPSATIGSE